MRLDKYLKVARLVKRRATAQEMSSVGAVRINGRQGKPSSTVCCGDVIEVAYPSRLLVVRVLCDEEAVMKRHPAEAAYEVQEERALDPLEKPW